MATMNDLANMYIAAGLTPPPRFVGQTTPVTDADVANTERYIGTLLASQPAPTTTTTTTTTPTSTGPVSAAQIQAIFDQYGVPYGAHSDGSFEDPTTRIQRLVNEVNSGQRTLASLTTAIQGIATTRGGFSTDVTIEDIQAIFDKYGVPYDLHTSGTYEDGEARLLRIVEEVRAGRSLANIEAAVRQIGQVHGIKMPSGENEYIPPGATLYKVMDPSGAAAYFASYKWNGLTLTYRIGGSADLKRLFPQPDVAFTQQITMSVDDYMGMNPLELGAIDEILGDLTPIAVSLNESLRVAGFESVPTWMSNDPQAMQIFAQGALENWSPGRILKQLSTTQGFRDRFVAWDYAMAQSGGDHLAAMQFYTTTETQLTKVLKTYRGPNADLSPEYLGEVMRLGWTAEVVAPILSAEQTLRAEPQILEDLNRLLVSSGLNPVGNVGAIALVAAGSMPDAQARAVLAGVDFTTLLAGNEPTEVFDLINDAMTLNALEEQGFAGLDLGFVRALRTETGGVLSKEAIAGFAQTAAINVLRFGRDIDRARYGLTEESLIAAAAQRPDPEGRTSAEVLEIMNRVVRERQAAAGGYDAFTGFTGRGGSLQLQGLKGL